jgi:predicted nucleic acid-binding protein
METMIIDREILPETIISYIHSEKIKVVKKNGNIILYPVNEKYLILKKSFGIFSDGKLSSERFMKEKELEGCMRITCIFWKRRSSRSCKEYLRNALDDENTKIFMNKINLLEVYYDVIKAYNDTEADKMFEIVKEMPVKIIAVLRDDVFKKAGQQKSKYKISIADLIAIAEAIIHGGSLITADHHEIGSVETAEKINVTWFR